MNVGKASVFLREGSADTGEYMEFTNGMENGNLSGDEVVGGEEMNVQTGQVPCQ